MSEIRKISVEELAELTASDAPAPGGGSISALAGAFGAALSCMVARLTLDKKGYEDAQDDMRGIIEAAELLRQELLDGISRDAESFDSVMTAISMPKDTDEQKLFRHEAMQEALKNASAIPLAIAEKAAEIMPLAELAVHRGNKNSVTDGLVAALLGRAAVRGAVFNVRINLKSIDDERYVGEMRARCSALEELVAAQESVIISLAPDLI